MIFWRGELNFSFPLLFLEVPGCKQTGPGRPPAATRAPSEAPIELVAAVSGGPRPKSAQNPPHGRSGRLWLQSRIGGCHLTLPNLRFPRLGRMPPMGGTCHPWVAWPNLGCENFFESWEPTIYSNKVHHLSRHLAKCEILAPTGTLCNSPAVYGHYRVLALYTDP